MFGSGAYLTDNEGVASFYAKKAAMNKQVERYTPTGILGSAQPVYKKGAEEAAEKAKVVNRFIADGNFYDSSSETIDEGLKSAIAESLAKNQKMRPEKAVEEVNYFLDIAKNNSKNIRDYRGELPYLINQIVMDNKAVLADISKYLESKGYDGVKFMSDAAFEGGGSNNYFVFNPGKTLKASLGKAKGSK